MRIAHTAQQVVLPISAHYAGNFTVTTTLAKDEYLLAKDFMAGESNIQLGMEKIPLLAQKKTDYAGQPIALVLAPTIWQANVNRQSLQVTYEGKPRFKLDMIHAGKSTDESLVGEVVVQRKVTRGFDLDYIFDSAHETYKKKYHIEGTILNLEDSLGAFACYELDKIVVYIISPWPQRVKESLQKVFNLQSNSIEIRSCKGSVPQDLFGVHAHLAACYVVGALLRTGKSSRLVLSGKRPFFSSNIGGNLHVEIAAARNKEGALLALRCHAVFHAGAFAIALDEVIDRMVWAFGVRYRKIALGINIEARRTQEEPALPESTFGVAGVNYVLELFLSTFYGADRHRSIKEWASIVYGKGDIDAFNHEWKHDTSYIAIIKKLYNISDYTRKYDAYQQEALLRKNKHLRYRLEPYRGIAMALGEIPSGFLRHHYSHLWVEMVLVSSVKLIVKTNAFSLNRNTNKIWHEFVSKQLRIEEQYIDFYTGSEVNLEAIVASQSEAGSMLGSNVHSMMMLLEDTCSELQKKRFREHLPISVMMQDKKYRRWKEHQFEGDLLDRISRIGVVSEVEVDIHTLNVYTRSLHIVADVGRVLAPSTALNQMYLDIEKTLHVLSHLHAKTREERDYPDVNVARTVLMPERIKVDFLEKRQRQGSKSRALSGLIQTVLPVAHIKAVNQALSSHISYMSLRNESIYLQHQWQDVLNMIRHRSGEGE
ncbi:molybdopterin-dependent oxidoreductase [Entomospira nematocerorum]|uniref:Molybdopterin-dependent oxidoreductase n=1 Tax=Entomospira nematocerorum TaxID=2719987 RepID=A0A968KSM2_9SPIO|nr:molybdopterin cofactor-binding domain-containing protein [Entomospira nematocera]NIZ46710.1 molybdopterin-dependent oxidoreductase [Entomospira nematocera]WDI33494.1 molybdopterin-dependent oxidoreductase [Entomospira nematocera]